MRIEEHSAADAARHSSAAAEAQKAHQISSAGAGPGTGSSDVLQLSTLAERIRGVFDDAAQAHAARVAEVTGQVQAGRYRVDTAGLSRALASEALGF